MSQFMRRYTNPRQENWSNELNNLFERIFYPLSAKTDGSNVESSQWMPAVDIKEEANQFKITVDLPGVEKKDVDISMENNVLTIRGERTDERKEEKENYYRFERMQGKFYRRFTLPETTDGDKIKARLDKGVLEILIPKKEPTALRKIEIESKT